MPSTVRTVLGIETSCDETAAAVVRGGRTALSNVVFSQIDQHRPHGGVVPEIASRCHMEALPGVVAEALREAGVAWGDIDAVAATRGPGLASSLLVGWSAAKGLARRLGRPLCGVNHIEAHLHSVFLAPEAPDPQDALPLVALIVSGGHTSLFRSERYGDYVLLGRTIDDAAGEALDKAAKLLGLGYPGGPEIDRLSRGVALGRNVFPAGRVKPTSAVLGDLRAELCFSFSGLKTSLRQRIRTALPVETDEIAGLAADYQEAVVEALVSRCEHALEGGGRFLAVGGGVSLNSRLRDRLRTLCDARGVHLLLARPQHCGDNAAMVAGLAGMGRGQWGEAVFALDVAPTWPVAESSPWEEQLSVIGDQRPSVDIQHVT